MRIVGGSHRGRKLVAPEGSALRPTSDRAREALFNILEHGRFAADGAVFRGQRVLDAFAGTGALGLEALSRGAAHAVFMESALNSISALRENIATLKETPRSTIVNGDVLRPKQAVEPCRLVLLDPPYDKGLGAPALTALAAAGWFAPDALAVLELGKNEGFEAPEGFVIEDERHYGAARLVFITLCGD